MRQFIEDTIEQIKGQPQKPKPPPVTVGVKEALAPGKIVTDIVESLTGVKSGQNIPTKEQYQEIQKQELAKSSDELSQVRQVLEQEKVQGQKTKQNIPGLKANTAVVSGQRTVQSETAPSYISGKPGYNPQRRAQMEKEAKGKLPELPKMSSKPRQGSWMQSIELKKKGTEIKSGPSG